MNRPIDIYFMIGLPICLAMVLAVVLVSGRLRPEVRTRFEFILAAVFYPIVVVYWLWRAVEYADEGGWFRGVLMVAAAIVFIILGAKALRQGRLAPTRGANK